MPEPATCDIPVEVYRVGRRGHLLKASEIDPADAVLPNAGNRFDVPGGSVLYAATELITCYAETLARYRVTPNMRTLLAGEDPKFMPAGAVPRDWRLQRQIAVIAAADPLPFLDIEDAATHAHLSDVLANDLVALGYPDNLDISVVSNQDRRLSRAIALYAYAAADDTGEPLYSGIRYCSRLQPDWECWAIFDGNDLVLGSEQPIRATDSDLLKVAEMWELRVH